MRRFQLINGVHYHRDAEGNRIRITKGQVVETEDDLCKKFVNKFVELKGNTIPPLPVNDPNEPQQEDDLLDEMTVDELRRHARENEINLKGANTKQEIIDVIRSVMKEVMG